MKLYTYYAEDEDFFTIIEDILKYSDYSDEILYNNLEIEDENNIKVFVIDNDSNTIIFDYSFFISFMKNFSNRIIDDYIEHNPSFLKGK